MSRRKDPPPGGLLDRPRIEPFGDANLLVTFADRLDLVANARAQSLATVLDDRPSGLGPPVPAHCSVLVPYDPEVLGPADAERAVRAALDRVGAGVGEARPSSASQLPAVEFPVRYGGADGPDLEEVAGLHDLTPDQVIELHAGVEYRVLVLGFAPGFAYLGVLDPRLVTPRRATPRPRVPRGSVAIAGEQTAVYPLETPGGWQILGRTDLDLWDPRRDPPALLRPGQRVRFLPAAG